MAKTKKTAVRTITRRKGWPKWARWRTVTDEGREFLWSRRPGAPLKSGIFDAPRATPFQINSSGRERDEWRKGWARSLRRIVAPRGKR